MKIHPLSRYAVLLALTIPAACADNPTGPVDVEGQYTLVEVDGKRVPFTMRENGCKVRVDSGSLVMESGRFDLHQRGMDECYGTGSFSHAVGSYQMEGRTVHFQIELFANEFGVIEQTFTMSGEANSTSVLLNGAKYQKVR